MSLRERLTRTCACFTGTVGCAVVCALVLLPIPMIVIGAVYINDCRIEDKIPIYLIVSGSVLIFFGCCQPRTTNEEGDAQHSPLGYILGLFSMAWLITGSVWVFSNYPPDYDNKDSIRYCNKTLYLFAFSVIIIKYSFVVLTALFCCVWILHAKCARPADVE